MQDLLASLPFQLWLMASDWPNTDSSFYYCHMIGVLIGCPGAIEREEINRQPRVNFDLSFEAAFWKAARGYFFHFHWLKTLLIDSLINKINIHFEFINTEIISIKKKPLCTNVAHAKTGSFDRTFCSFHTTNIFYTTSIIASSLESPSASGLDSVSDLVAR